MERPDNLDATPKGSIAIVESQAPVETYTPQNEEDLSNRETAIQLKNTSMSTLSIILTLISIALAFTYVHSFKLVLPRRHYRLSLRLTTIN
jgi:hypothetical protein